MKYIIALGVMLSTVSAFGQFGGRLPDNKSWGLKASFNYYLPSYKTTNPASEISNNTNTGFGGGAYFRYDFNDLVSFQPELLFASRSGSVTGVTTNEVDTNITITETSVSNVAQTTIELPLNLKFRWEFIARHQGAWKSNSTLGVVTGPRLVFNMASSRTTSSSEVTSLYGQQSTEVRDLSTTNATDYFSPFSFGWGVGVDYEFAGRMIVYGNYFRGLTSMNKPEFGFKSFDNRFEVGLGIRIY
ncbi:MAG: PorT family protein [bacterium]|nr:PorT family protein [bacterium]